MRFEPNNWDLKTRILATVAYFSVFELNLNIYELQRCLLGNSQSISDIRKVLDEIPQITVIDNVYVLKNGLTVQKDNRDLVEKFWRKIFRFTWIFKQIPFIRFAGICNYISFGIIDKKSDIDIFVIAKDNRIFTSKFFLTVLMHLLGIRRHGKHIAKRFCLSFFITDDNINLDYLLIPGYDIYVAYWLMGLVPIYGSDVIWEKIGNDNLWIDKYFENFSARRVDYKKDRKYKDRLFKKLFEGILGAGFGDFIENKLEKMFKKRYEKNKKTFPENASIIVSKKVLKYHLNDQRKIFREKFERKLKSLGLFD
jgi:hypothetical protein